MMDFLGLSLIASGVVIIVVSLLHSRHSPDSEPMKKIREGLSGEQLSKLKELNPPRAAAHIGFWFGTAFVLVGVIRVALIQWLWWGW